MFDIFKKLVSSRTESGETIPAPRHVLLQDFIDEIRAHPDAGYGGLKPDVLGSGREILAAPETVRIDIVKQLLAFTVPYCRQTTWRQQDFVLHGSTKTMLSRLLRTNLPFTDADLCEIMTNAGTDLAYSSTIPADGVLRAVERFLSSNPLTPDLRLSIDACRKGLAGSRMIEYASTRKLTERLLALLSGVRKRPLLITSHWSRSVEESLRGQSEANGSLWTALLAEAGSIGDQARPTKKWIKATASLVDQIGAETVTTRLREWLEPIVPDPLLPDPNIDTMKGLIWCSAHGDPEVLAYVVGRLGELCFRKIPGQGPRSPKLGNACLYALSAMTGGRGAAELSRLKGKVRYPSAVKLIHAALSRCAESTGHTLAELEESSIPDFGLGPDGVLVQQVADFSVRLAITGTDTVGLTWSSAGGRSFQSTPAGVAEKFPEQVKAIKRLSKEVQSTLTGQALRLEQLFIADRQWSVKDWRQRYLDHPLLSELSRRLIWRRMQPGQTASFIVRESGFLDQHGEAMESPRDETSVAIWHPAQADVEEVQNWRKTLEAFGVTQPFKQAHREIYILTDAERTTGTYSNRFAAHIIRQHQFRAICLQRGWEYKLQGGWDSYNVPTRRIEGRELSVEFWVEPLSDAEDGSTGYAHLSTDKVRFVHPSSEPLELRAVPPLVFSEAMRDVDLFVSVTSVGNDPNWVDGGRNGAHLGYWNQYAFGDLGPTAQTRKQVLDVLLPKLKIADRCSLSDRFLVIRGTKRTYKIHLGSANVMMEPNDQYLCIVRDASKGSKVDKVYLPFEGDTTLSLVLSKAFMLANDDKITDTSIVRQIERS